MTSHTNTPTTAKMHTDPIVEPISHPDWPIVHGFFGRSLGLSWDQHQDLKQPHGHTVSHRINKTAVVAAQSLGYLNGGSRSILPTQEHTSRVLILPKDAAQIHMPADALVTQDPNWMIGVLTADCGPILLYDPEAEVIGAVHAGWRGAVSGIIENTIQAMAILGATKPNLSAIIGPMIQKKSYPVSADFVEKVGAATPREMSHNISQTFEFLNNQWFFDLPRYIHMRLQPFVANIHDSGVNTFGDTFFSHRYALAEDKKLAEQKERMSSEYRSCLPMTTKTPACHKLGQELDQEWPELPEKNSQRHHGRNIAWISLEKIRI